MNKMSNKVSAMSSFKPEAKNSKIYYVEGNVGAGKTTFLHKIKESGYFERKYPTIKIAYIFEPVNDWLEYKDSKGVDILSHFYQNQEKYGFSFQWYVFMTRIKAISDEIEKGTEMIFVERSVFTDKNVFMKTLKMKNKITDIEFKIYNDWFDWCVAKFLTVDYKFIYLNLPTKDCYERIKLRSRDAEKIIEYDYLDLLNVNHDNWLLNPELTDSVIPIIANYNINNLDEMEKIFNIINTKLIKDENKKLGF